MRGERMRGERMKGVWTRGVWRGVRKKTDVWEHMQNVLNVTSKCGAWKIVMLFGCVDLHWSLWCEHSLYVYVLCEMCG